MADLELPARRPTLGKRRRACELSPEAALWYKHAVPPPLAGRLGGRLLRGTVPAKTWNFSVTALGATTPLHEGRVDGPHWMAALRAGRLQMAEPGEVPQGASCSVAADGVTTVLDGAGRRRYVLTPAAAGTGERAAAPAAAAPPPEAPARTELELMLERDVAPTADNPLHYRERAYLAVPGMSVIEAEAALRWKLADLQREVADLPKGKFVNLAAFDHRWKGTPERPPIVVLQWRDWRDEVAVDYPAPYEPRSAEDSTDERLTDAFEALHELTSLDTPAGGLDYALKLLGRLLPSEAISACLYDINTDELRFVAVSGIGADARQGHAVARTTGLLGVAVREEGRVSVFSDPSAHADFDPAADGRPGVVPRQLVYRPLVHDGQLMGLLQLVNRVGADAFSTQDVELVDYVARRLAEFLREARARSQRPPGTRPRT